MKVLVPALAGPLSYFVYTSTLSSRPATLFLGTAAILATNLVLFAWLAATPKNDTQTQKTENI